MSEYASPDEARAALRVQLEGFARESGPVAEASREVGRSHRDHGERVEPGPSNFAEAARAALNTPNDQRERGLAEIIAQLETTAGAKDSPERTAFRQEQAAIGDEISRTADPERRAELREDREAQGHLYAAGLADRIGGQVLGVGQVDTAGHLHSLAEAHREIAALLRGPDGSDGGPPEGPAPDKDIFARDAAQASGLGESARTVHVADMRGRNPDEVQSRAGGRDYSALRDEGLTPSRPENTLTRAVSVGMGPGGAVLYEINQDRPENRRADYWESHSGASERRAEQDAKQRPVEYASPTEARAAIRNKLAEFTREAEQEREAGLEQAQGRDTVRAAFRGFGS